MTLRDLRLPLTLLAAALMAGCSHDDAPAAPSAAASPAYAAIARGRIDIEGGLLKLTMPAEGVVAQVEAHEGEHVHKGQLLAQLELEPAKLALDTTVAEQQQAAAQIGAREVRARSAALRASRLEQAAKAGAGDVQSAV